MVLLCMIRRREHSWRQLNRLLIEAMEHAHWNKAMDKEYEALIKNKTWHLVSPQLDINVVDCKWVYKLKKKADGTIECYKARLVAKCFR